jgi:diguanylate cyclase (GGDEF)-like protein
VQYPPQHLNFASAAPGKIMTRFTFSIRARLMLFIMAFLVIVVAMAVGGVLSLTSVNRKTEELDQKWLAGTAVLAELDYRIAEFRIAEGYRALAAQPQVRAEAESLANESRREIQDLQNEYVKVIGSQIQRAELDTFRTAWQAYYAEHDAWVKADADGTLDDPARYNSSLHRRYKAADAAVDSLIAANMSAAHAQATAVDQLTDRAIVSASAISAAAILLALWLLVRVRSQITQPLGAITQALSKLAAGNREIRVPELHRADEIGEMAKAFDIFRTNSLALEQAHEATRAAQEQAHTLARHDALTGLPNRRVFSAELQAALSRAQSGAAPYSVLLIGLDQFKQVNDLQGHPVGDMVLCEVARRLGEIVGNYATVARLGGDEFAIIAAGEVEQQAHLEGAKRLARSVLGAIRRPILVGARTVEISACIGVASCHADSTDAASLLHAADIAMYRAKRDGRGTFRFFEPSMDEDLRAQAALETDLKRALAEGNIQPYYQPLVELRSNRIRGFEALARWEHPERGFVPPDVFIPLVEQLGLMPDLTSSVLRQVCRDARQWAEDIRLSVNISPTELKDPLLPSRLLAILAQEGFPPARLEIEITETALVSDIETAKSILTTLQSLGVTVSLDDFGTGYSSLYHLRELKFDKVKIDQSFVRSMQNSRESEKIVDAILGLAKNLHLPTVAEGIEDPAVLMRLAAKGCEYGQGYYFGAAMTADSAREILNRRNDRPKAA